MMYEKDSKEYKAMKEFIVKQIELKRAVKPEDFENEETCETISRFWNEHTRGKVACFLKEIIREEGLEQWK